MDNACDLGMFFPSRSAVIIPLNNNFAPDLPSMPLNNRYALKMNLRHFKGDYFVCKDNGEKMIFTVK